MLVVLNSGHGNQGPDFFKVGIKENLLKSNSLQDQAWYYVMNGSNMMQTANINSLIRNFIYLIIWLPGIQD